MVERTYLDHYTQQDIAQIERIKTWLESNQYTQAALGRLARVSTSTLNQIINGVYIASPTKQLSQIDQAMAHADAASVDSVNPVETSVFKLAQTSCAMARRYRNFAVFTGYVGTGKTFALKHYVSTHSNTHLIESTPNMTPSSLIKMLARRVTTCDSKGSVSDQFDAIVEVLKDTDSLLIIDEAEFLSAKQLHTLRRLRDLANVGILLAGTEHLHALLKPEYGQFDQIRSRTGFWPETIQKITEEDAAALIQDSFGTEDVPDAVVRRLYQYAKGSARMLVEGLLAGIKAFRKDKVLDVRLVDAVATQVLCLKSLAKEV